MVGSVEVVVEAQPASIRVRPDATALVVVDMQNDFAAAGGMFARAGIDISSVRAAIEPMALVVEACRAAGISIFYLKMGFQPDLSDAGAPNAPNWLKHVPLGVGEVTTAPDGSPSRILIRDTWNTDIIDELTPEGDDVVIYKHRYSGFFQTQLDEVLRARGVDTLLFVGATTSVCVESTVRDAMFLDYHCLVLADCTAEPIGEALVRSNHDASLLVLQVLFASISDAAHVLSALGSEVGAA